MRYSKKQIESDATMVSILEANAVEIFEKNGDRIPSAEEKVLASQAPLSEVRVHVDKQGFLTTKS